MMHTQKDYASAFVLTRWGEGGESGEVSGVTEAPLADWKS